MKARKLITSIRKPTLKLRGFAPFTPLDFEKIDKKAHKLADTIEKRFEALAHILLEYESYEVVCDEVSRTLDLLRSLKENEEYFKLRTGEVTAFLPRNQPLYALSCFVLIPSLMASEVHFRIPHSMRHFFPKLLALLDIYESFPNVIVSNKERNEFMSERSALRVDPKTEETYPVTDVVIFTGTSVHADQLRLVFDERTLFIANGSGHNPVIVSKDADLHKAVEAVLTLQLYNQGQDCAAPNAVLIHKDVFRDFLRFIRDEIRTVRVGQYSDKSCRVGPISDPKDLVRVEDILIRHREWLDPTTPGIIRAYDAILEPTIICKPLSTGGNFSEVFAPVIFLQQYEKDEDLALYFENQAYSQNAMYVSIYGTSDYAEKLVSLKVDGKQLHDRTTVLHNTHLHAPWMERGTQPYGGYGYGASNLSINGKIMPKPTLPQRDIFQWKVKPLLGKDTKALQADLRRFSKTELKDVQKLLRLKSAEEAVQVKNTGDGSMSDFYVDYKALEAGERRYIKVTPDHAYRLLETPNTEYIAKLSPSDLTLIRAVRNILQKPPEALEEFTTALYALPKKPKASDVENRTAQLRMFQNLYQLLLKKERGPRLAQFLQDIDREKACELLDV
jgi:acyl-CoA reductase-like NAD-dependent aldehyde dehydrogenase